MYKVDHQKSSYQSLDLVPKMRSKHNSDFKNTKNEKTSRGNTLGVRDFSSVSILSQSKGSIQPKLKINSPGDKYEQEADYIAGKVMQSSDKTVQRKCNKCEDEMQSIQTKSKGDSGNTASIGFANELQSASGGGIGLDSSTKSFMESKIGGDFSKVKIHADSRAARLNQEINARAFTLNNNIYFNRGEFAPTDNEGKRLLAHELVHTVQQSGGKNQGFVQKADKKKKEPVKTKTKVEVVTETDLKKGTTEGKASTTRSAEEKVSDKIKASASEKTTGKGKTVTTELKASDKDSGLSATAGAKATTDSNPAIPDKVDTFLKVGGKWTLLDKSYLKLSTGTDLKLSTDKGPQLTLDSKAIFFPNGTLTPEIAAGFLLDKKGFTATASGMLKWQIIDILSAQAGVNFTLNPDQTFEAKGTLGVALSF